MRERTAPGNGVIRIRMRDFLEPIQGVEVDVPHAVTSAGETGKSWGWQGADLPGSIDHLILFHQDEFPCFYELTGSQSVYIDSCGHM